MLRRLTPFLSTAALMASCATAPPTAELVEARQKYQEAAASNAKELVPARLLSAKQALDAAERAHAEEAQSDRERTLVYIATRQVQLAMTYGTNAAEAQRRAEADKSYLSLQSQLREQAEEELGQTRKDLEGARGALSEQ